mmetsp:Transcript_6637/g.21456  ORF Transcript_6637/g.21456 Transcript_6637/m.21456 type:complete len:287 (+) Transcript_6637:360-1220(+)
MTRKSSKRFSSKLWPSSRAPREAAEPSSEETSVPGVIHAGSPLLAGTAVAHGAKAADESAAAAESAAESAATSADAPARMLTPGVMLTPCSMTPGVTCAAREPVSARPAGRSATAAGEAQPQPPTCASSSPRRRMAKSEAPQQPVCGGWRTASSSSLASSENGRFRPARNSAGGESFKRRASASARAAFAAAAVHVSISDWSGPSRSISQCLASKAPGGARLLRRLVASAASRPGADETNKTSSSEASSSSMPEAAGASSSSSEKSPISNAVSFDDPRAAAPSRVC